jgi:hypothetical protein
MSETAFVHPKEQSAPRWFRRNPPGVFCPCSPIPNRRALTNWGKSLWIGTSFQEAPVNKCRTPRMPATFSKPCHKLIFLNPLTFVCATRLSDSDLGVGLSDGALI